MKNEKSQKGIALIWVVLASALFVTGVEMALVSRTKKQVQDITGAQQVSQQKEIKKEVGEEREVFTGKINEFINKNVPFKCTYAQAGYTGVSFIEGKKMYSEISRNGESGYTIIKDNCMWNWGWGAEQGTKICFGGDIWETPEAIPAGVEYQCVPFSFTDSQFEPPTDINFIATGETVPLSDEDLLKILPSKERSELESAIRETQQVLQNIEVFNFAPPTADDIGKSLSQINKQAQEQIQKSIQKQQQKFQPPQIDTKKIEEYFNQNPPAIPGVKSPNEQQLEEFERETGIDLDAPYGDCPNCK